MNLEKQVVSLELAKKMKELGFKQESLWWWRKLFNDSYKIQSDHDLIKDIGVYFSAYTVAELGEMLPSQYHSWKSILDEEGLGKGCLCVRFSEPEFDSSDEHWISADTEANARAKMLIWLIENKHMEV